MHQTSELSRRIRDSEKAVKHLVVDDHVSGTNGQPTAERTGSDPEAQQRRDTIAHDAGSDDDDESEDEDSNELHSMDELENEFHTLEEEVANLVADVHDLALFTKLNITGFMKILKVRFFLCLHNRCLPLFPLET